jgi:RNA polymerase sigma-B factor
MGILSSMAGDKSGPPLMLRIIEYPSAVVIHASGTVEFATVSVLRAVLFDLLAEPRHVMLDLSGVNLLDGHSVGVLVAAQRHAEQHRASLWARGATGRVLRVLEVTDVAKLLGLDQSDLPFETGDHAGPDRHSEQDRTAEILLRARQRQPLDEPVRSALRQLVIQQVQGLAVALARRYRGRGEPVEDLTQVALLGLIKAVDGYDPEHGTAFTAYAVPTIIGELKRYFRDKGWQIRVPRRLQEIGLELAGATDTLAQRLGRAPTIAELAVHLDTSEDQILEAIEAAKVYRPGSLSAPLGGEGDGLLVDQLGSPDHGFDLVEYRETLRPLLAALPARQLHIVTLRFYGNLTQSQIAAKIGISQMHVSRLLADALAKLRHGLTAD